MIRIQNIKLPLSGDWEQLKKKAARELHVPKERILEMKLHRRSLDARKKDQIHYVCVVDVLVEEEDAVLANTRSKQAAKTPNEAYVLPSQSTASPTLPHRPIVVGFGPAGMFAALLLAQMGLRPIVLERGGDVDSRTKAVHAFWTDGKQFDAENNVQFGEGGAGTFSDGKLTTRIKDPRCRKVLEELVAAGAPEDILYEAKPHIGTDVLCGVVKQIRKTIEALGGEIRFFSKVIDFKQTNASVTAVMLADGTMLETSDVVLALGHSARDTFTKLHETNVSLEQKPFAMGLRIEHPQEMINEVQYGASASQLPAADYKLTHTTKQGRGVYTFCMCPGGHVVAASSEEGRLAVNGMSLHARDGANANSALLVQVFPADFPSAHPLAGMHWQQALEERAYVLGGSDFTAPIQSVGAFLGQAEPKAMLSPTYQPQTKEADLRTLFPSFLTEALQEAIPAMGKRLPGFDRADAILTGIESRSSSPIRILRQASGESISTKGLYPCGEGAGYAGGIISAAVDGIFIAEQIFKKYQ